jgi:hypothetical protein
MAMDDHAGPKSLADSQMALVLEAQMMWNETCLKTDCEEAPLIPHG